MKNYFKHIEYLIKRLILLLLIFSISRVYFYFLNQQYFQSLSFIGTIKIFFIGIRFDIIAIIAFNFVFIILHLVPGNFKNKNVTQWILKLLFIVVNTVIICTNFLDSEYFSFTNKRTTADILRYIFISDDIYNLMPQFIHDYWYSILCWISLMIIVWFLYPKYKKIKRHETLNLRNYLYQSVISVFLLGIFLIGFRGTRLKPLRILSASQYTSTQNIPLVLNTPFTILKTLNSKDLNILQYFREDEIRNIYFPVHNYKDTGSFKQCNVIIIILESFSKEYIGSLNNNEGYTPFLDSLIQNSLAFTNGFANGKKSIEAMPAIIAGLPTLMDNSYVSSSYSTNTINSLAGILRNEGYHTTFFHGGSNGTMGFDQFANIAGIKEYYGRNEYNNERDYDGNWGIFDEEFLQFFANKLNSFDTPFFSCVFTLSSHHPYTIPEKHKNKFPEGSLKIHRGIRYADYALRKFFETASLMPWFSNTLFIITADHTAQPIDKFYQNKVGIYAVPIIYFHHNDSNLAGYDHTITQHIDIMPSVLDYLNYQNEFIAFGNSIFDLPANHFAINYLNGVYQLIEKEHT